MVVLVLLACLQAQPGYCTSVNVAGKIPRHQCEAFAGEEAREFEARNPKYKVSKSFCLRQGGVQV